MAHPLENFPSLQPAEALAFLREVRSYAIFMVDLNGRVLTWNDGAQAIKGYTANEIIGQSFSRFYPAEDIERGKPFRLLRQAAKEGRVEDEGWRVRKDGSCFWADAVLTAVHEGDQLVGFVKVTRDLTERRRAEQELRQSEERFRLLIESVHDYAIYMLDPKGNIATWNIGAEKITGYRADEVLGRHFSILYTAEDAAAGRAARELRIAAQEGRYEEESWRVRKNGDQFAASIILTAIRDPDNQELRGFAKVTRDLTERKAMESRIRDSDEAADKNRIRADNAKTDLRLRDEFISIAAHELRTPLATLQLKTQSMQYALRGQDGDVKIDRAMLEDRLQGSMRQIQRMTQLVERLLDVSRLVSGQIVTERREVDLGALVQVVVRDMAEPLAQAGSNLQLHIDGRIIGYWDRSRIEQVVTNLLSNAVKYGAGNPIDVRLETRDENALIIVTDGGIGIAEESLARIFGRFERAAPSRNYAGFGIGLYVAQKIVEAHGGSIKVESRLGEGSTFTVMLPFKMNIATQPTSLQKRTK